MTERKLKHKLFGLVWIFILLALIFALLTLSYLCLVLYSCQYGLRIGVSITDSLFIFLTAATCITIAAAFSRRSDIKRNRSLAGSKEALQRLVDEYNSTEALHLKEGRKVVNALLPSCVLLLSAGIILPYKNIAKAHIIQYNVLKRRGNAVDITRKFTLVTTDGKEIDLFTVQNQENVDAVVEYISKRNPDCQATGEVAEIKRI